MEKIDTIVIGAGQAGLATSRCLSDRGVEHLVLERGRVAERWRSERWDSLRLLTPNWQSRLPGHLYRGGDPEGFMTRAETVALLEEYARGSACPVKDGTRVLEVAPMARGYRVRTDRGGFLADHVVLATGYADLPRVPAWASQLTPEVHQVVPTRYRTPDALPAGGVLVVGASATGLQLAEEIHRSGHPVTLAVGRHTRLPRRYRGHDILYWLEVMGVLDERAEEVRDLAASRRQPSMQLVGRPDRATLDLAALATRGVRLVGRALGTDGVRVHLADDLGERLRHADRKLDRLLGRIDAFIARSELDATFPGASRPEPVRPAPAPGALHVGTEGIRSIVWATGYRRAYPWLRVPVLDARGELVHQGGVTPSPGLYAMGLSFMRRRKSSFLDGVGDDALEIVEHLVAARPRARAA